MQRFAGLLLSLLCLPALAQFQLSSDFQSWLNSHGYGSYDFNRGDLSNAAYGGRDYAGQAISRQPVIFIHGNSDKANGWADSIDYFLDHGYSRAEIYATTWGPASAALAAQQYHSLDHLDRVRSFIQAVLAYTGASKVDVIGHSMGVTLLRKAIMGGSGHDSLAGGSYNLGGSLTSKIDTFVGIAGANQGLTSCYLSGPSTPTCGSTNGFYPGYLYYGLGPYGVSDFLENINQYQGYEGAYVFSIWSYGDSIIGYNNLVYGKRTSRIPGQDGEAVYNTYGHFQSKDLTADTQYSMVTAHTP